VAVGGHDVNTEVLGGVKLCDLFDIGRASRRDQGFALQVGKLLNTRVFLVDDSICSYKRRRCIRDLLLTIRIIGC